MPDNKLAIEVAVAAGFAHAAEAFPNEIAAAFAAANTLRVAVIRPADPAAEPTTTYRVTNDRAVTS